MGLFDLLANLLQYLVVWVPRPFLVNPTQAYVRWTLGGAPKLVKGWGLNIPLIHQSERMDVRTDACECEPKNLWTKDGFVIALGIAFSWRISDPLRVASRINDLHTFTARMAESVLPELVGTYTLADFKRRCAGGEGRQWGANALLRTKLQGLFDDYGISIDEAYVNFTDDKVQTIKLIGGGNESSSISVLASDIL
jgi:hypothetical protein